MHAMKTKKLREKVRSADKKLKKRRYADKLHF